MKIEKMAAGDLNGVVRLAVQLGYPDAGAGIEKRFAEIQNNNEYALFTARSSSGNVIGWIQINVDPISLLVPRKADIAALVVDEHHRGQGVGKALVLRAEQWAKENHLPLIRVKSNVKREGAHRFYQREGYTLAKTSNLFVKTIS